MTEHKPVRTSHNRTRLRLDDRWYWPMSRNDARARLLTGFDARESFLSAWVRFGWPDPVREAVIRAQLLAGVDHISFHLQRNEGCTEVEIDLRP